MRQRFPEERVQKVHQSSCSFCQGDFHMKHSMNVIAAAVFAALSAGAFAQTSTTDTSQASQTNPLQSVNPSAATGISSDLNISGDHNAVFNSNRATTNQSTSASQNTSSTQGTAVGGTSGTTSATAPRRP